MDALINVTNLCVNYKALEKEEGLKGSFSNFFNRKYVEIPAVKELNLHVMPGEISTRKWSIWTFRTKWCRKINNFENIKWYYSTK